MAHKTTPIAFWFERPMRRMERRYAYNLDYLRHVWHVSRGAFRRFAFGFMWFASGRDALPADAAAIAGIVSTRHADCGPCTQITVDMALEAGVDPAVLKAAIAGDLDHLPHALALVYRFAHAVVTADITAGDMRPHIVDLYGEKGLVDLATAIAVGQVYPAFKRTLGFGDTCLQVTINAEPVKAQRLRAHAAAPPPALKPPTLAPPPVR